MVPTPFPANPLPPTTLSHLGGRWHLTARFSRELFLRVPGMAPGSMPKSALRAVVRGDAVPLLPEAQDRPAFCPDSFLRVEHATLPSSSPLVSLAARFRLSAQGAAYTCLATSLLFLPGQALLLPDRFPTTRPTAPSLLWGRHAAPAPDLLLGSVVTVVSLSLRPFQMWNHASLLGKEDFAPCGYLPACCGD